MPFSWKKRKPVIILSFLIFAQLILISVQAPLGEEDHYLKRFTFSVFSAVQNGSLSLFRRAAGIWRDYFALHGARAENARLRKELVFLRQENTLLHSLLQVYRSEEEIRKVLAGIVEGILPARVIGLDAGNIWKSLTINKGSLDGVEPNMVVLNDRGHLVGRVIGPVSLKESRVQLITDNESGVHVKPAGKEVPGVLAGRGNGTCQLEFVLSTDTEVVSGDLLITTGSDGVYLPDLPAGRVRSVVRQEGLFKRIEVEPLFTIGGLETVAVITRGAEAPFREGP